MAASVFSRTSVSYRLVSSTTCCGRPRSRSCPTDFAQSTVWLQTMTVHYTQLLYARTTFQLFRPWHCMGHCATYPAPLRVRAAAAGSRSRPNSAPVMRSSLLHEHLYSPKRQK